MWGSQRVFFCSLFQKFPNCCIYEVIFPHMLAINFQNKPSNYIIVVSFLVWFLNWWTLWGCSLHHEKMNPFFFFELYYLFFFTWTAQWKEFVNLTLAFKKYLVCTIWNCKLNYFGGDLKWVSSTYKLVLEPKGACSQYIL